MKPQLKAALLNAFAYPGAGHFFLKKNLIGIIFATAFSILFLLTLGDIFAIAQCTANEIVKSRASLSLATILEAAHSPSVACSKLAEYKYVPIMIIIWIFSIVDAFRLGNKMT